MQPDNRLRAIRMLNDLEHIDDVLAHRKMEFDKADVDLQKRLRTLARTIRRKLEPLTDRKY